MIAGIGELVVGELLGLALDLLHRQDVDRFAHREVDDPVDAGADGVDIPGCEPHETSLKRGADVAERPGRSGPGTASCRIRSHCVNLD
jgi:hypothetical protein